MIKDSPSFKLLVYIPIKRASTIFSVTFVPFITGTGNCCHVIMITVSVKYSSRTECFMILSKFVCVLINIRILFDLETIKGIDAGCNLSVYETFLFELNHRTAIWQNELNYAVVLCVLVCLCYNGSHNDDTILALSYISLNIYNVTS